MTILLALLLVVILLDATFHPISITPFYIYLWGLSNEVDLINCSCRAPTISISKSTGDDQNKEFCAINLGTRMREVIFNNYILLSFNPMLKDIPVYLINTMS